MAKEAKKRGFKGVVFGLSGGVDSAVVAALCVRVFGANARGFILPSCASDPKHTEDARRFAQSIGLYYEIIDISEVVGAFAAALEPHENLARLGNLAARIRMTILYDKSALHKALVVGTSNKSELMLGYGTIFGDLACAINPIGGLFKTEIFELARFLNIPKPILDKKPSADLYRGQSDEAELGFPYAKIDALLAEIQKGVGEKELILGGFEKPFVKAILKRMRRNAFKLQMPKIAKI